MRLRHMMLVLILGGALVACAPPTNNQPERLSAVEAKVAALEMDAILHRRAGSQAAYTFVMSEDPVSVALADEGELPLLVTIGDVTTHGDSQSVTLRITNPNSVRLAAIKFNVSWRSGDAQNGPREIEWSGALDPGYRRDVSFRIGPIAAEDLTSITISDVRSRWMVKAPSSE